MIGDINLASLNAGNVAKTGMYYPDTISYLLKEYDIDLVCILSICPETFSYTLSEAIANKCIPIVTNIGALGNRMKNYDFGWSVNRNNIVEEVCNIINELENNPEILAFNKTKMDSVKYKSINDMCNEYAQGYKELFSKRRKNTYVEGAGRFLFKASEFEIDDFYKENDIDGNAKNELLMIKNSLSFRFIQRMSYIRIPFRNQLRQIVARIVK